MAAAASSRSNAAGCVQKKPLKLESLQSGSVNRENRDSQQNRTPSTTRTERTIHCMLSSCHMLVSDGHTYPCPSNSSTDWKSLSSENTNRDSNENQHPNRKNKEHARPLPPSFSAQFFQLTNRGWRCAYPCPSNSSAERSQQLLI